MRRDVLARVLSPPRALVVRRRAPERVDDGEVDGDVAPGRGIVAPFERGRPDASSAARGRAAARARSVARRARASRVASWRDDVDGREASLW